MRRRVHASELADIFQTIRLDEDLPIEFSNAALSEADSVEPEDHERRDLRDVPFVTIDPPGAMDLDQAMAFESLPDGNIRLRYAIADVPAFVAAGSALDLDARQRGTTVYCPDGSVPLHPTVLSEGGASLLPDRDRPAIVFEIDVDREGELIRSDVARATVRSRQRLDYSSVQERFDADDPPAPIAPLERFGIARIRLGVERGAINLRLPEQETVHVEGHWRLVNREELEVERWNAQVSLLTGMVAADMMVEAGIGILRTLPAPTPEAIGMLRGAAKGLGIAWTRDETPAEVLAGLDPARPRQLALFEHATRLLRGAGYRGFKGGVPDEDLDHSGLAATYAHVTAPLRRLVDRFTLATCLAVAADEPVPEWVVAAIDEIPEVMEATGRRAGTVERRCIDAVEAWVLRDRIDERFDAVVLSSSSQGSEVWIDEPPILTWIHGLNSQPGKVISVEIAEADPVKGSIKLEKVA
ncbi:MAG: RNB domain-containing ribonuclease [Acidimicrobiia bacterium]